MSESITPENLTLVECQNSTTHDSSVAIYHRGQFGALEAERADRVKHSANPTEAYQRLKSWLFRTAPPILVIDNFSAGYKPQQDISHHLGHAASVFFGSEFQDAAILVADGMGPASTTGHSTSTSMWYGMGSTIKREWEITERGMCLRSLGHFYSAITYYLGLGFYDQSHTMSLAAFGDPTRMRKAVSKLIWIGADGVFEVDQDFIYAITYSRFGSDFSWQADPALISESLQRASSLLGPPRRAGEPFERRHYDIAATAQAALEDCIVSLLKVLFRKAPSKNLCLAGGVALNCVANQRAFERSQFEKLFILSAPGDSGIALGKLFYRLYTEFQFPRHRARFQPFLGPVYPTDSAIDDFLQHHSGWISKSMSPAALSENVATVLGGGVPVGIYQDRCEFGPRALGHRSILCDARSPDSIELINSSIKKREPYRPLAPAILESEMGRYFLKRESVPFMTRALPATEFARQTIPGAIHVDGTARAQTVVEEDGLLYRILGACADKIECPVVVNTSMNVEGQPMVESPEDALSMFAHTKLRYLVINNCLVQRG